MLKIVETPPASAEKNMTFDAQTLSNLDPNGDCILHFYEWEKKSATYGYFINPEKYFNMEKVNALNLDLARRPTGGGIVFHIWDFAFSIFIPANKSFFYQDTYENYAFINRCVIETVKEFLPANDPIKLAAKDFVEKNTSCKNFCMARPTKYDVILHDKKIAGAAQRKQKNGYLHQGTILLTMPDKEYLSTILLPNKTLIDSFFLFSHPILGKTASQESISLAKEKIKKILASHLEKAIDRK